MAALQLKLQQQKEANDAMLGKVQAECEELRVSKDALRIARNAHQERAARAKEAAERAEAKLEAQAGEVRELRTEVRQQEKARKARDFGRKAAEQAEAKLARIKIARRKKVRDSPSEGENTRSGPQQKLLEINSTEWQMAAKLAGWEHEKIFGVTGMLDFWHNTQTDEYSKEAPVLYQ